MKGAGSIGGSRGGPQGLTEPPSATKGHMLASFLSSPAGCLGKQPLGPQFQPVMGTAPSSSVTQAAAEPTLALENHSEVTLLATKVPETD